MPAEQGQSLSTDEVPVPRASRGLEQTTHPLSQNSTGNHTSQGRLKPQACEFHPKCLLRVN